MSTEMTDEESARVLAEINSPNYWPSRIAECREEGYREITPNGLPICSIRFQDKLLMENEHADHPTYMFPVEATWSGPPPETDELGEYADRTLALIYTDGNIALTLHEYCYDIWSVESGRHLHGQSWFRDWKLTPASLGRVEKRSY